MLSQVRPFATPWTAERQASFSSTISGSLHRFMSIELVMLFNHLILCCPLLLLPLIFHNIRVFSNELALCIRWPKYLTSALASVLLMNGVGGGLVMKLKPCPTFVTPWTVALQAPLSMGFSRQEHWSGFHFLLQGIFPTQELNQGLQHCKQILYRLSYF